MEQHTQKDEEEAKRECQFFESVLRSDSRPLSYVEHLSSTIKAILSDTYNLTLWRRDFFIKQTLPRAIQTLLKRGDLDDDEAAQINNFFQEVIGFIVRLIPHDYVEILETLTRLFTSARCNFYLKYGKDDPNDDYPMYSSDDKQPEFTNPQGWETSYFLLSNINYFGRLGGFDCIIERLRSNTPSKPNLTIVKHLIKPTFKIRDNLDAGFLRTHVEHLLELVPTRVLSLSDEELKNEDKKTISDISRNLEGLVRVAFPNRPCEAIDKFNLDVALKCFRSPYLEKRLAGLNDIKEFINMVRKEADFGKMRQGSGYMMANLHKNDVSCIDSTTLANWLRNNNILEQLYGENMHPELVRRCVDVPRFLSTEGMLEDKHLDLIWEASEGKHESIIHLIYTSIGDLSATLPLVQLDHLYKKICNIPFNNYSVQTVNLIRTFSFNALQSSIHNQLDNQYGSPILWDLMQDSTPVSHDVAHQALMYLTEMLGWQPLAHLRPIYAVQCINNIKQHNSVVMSLRLIRQLMEMTPPKRKKLTTGMGAAITQESQILELLEAHDLLTVFFEDLDHFKNTARAAIAAGSANLDIKNVVLVGKFQYMLEIKERLGFLDHILTTQFTLGIPQITTLWNDLVIKALVPEERDETFQWLEHARAVWTAKPNTPPSEDPMFHLFLELVPQLPMDQLSREGFAFFDFFFRYVNFKLHKLTQTDNKPFVVQAWDLVGLPTLWRIVLEVKDWHVGKQAISLLNRAHKNVAQPLIPTAGVHLANYLSECMQHLTVASRERRELQLERCLALLLTILEEFETKRVGIIPAGARKRHGVCTQGTTMTLNWCVYNGPKSTIVTHSNETIGTIRAKAAQKYEIPFDHVRLISGGKEFKFDSETLGEHKLMDGHLITIAKRAKIEPEVEPTQDAAHLPSTILSQQQYFHQLFDLLTFNETIGKKVWDLLMLLPTNSLMLDELSELSTHPVAAQNGTANGVEADAVRWGEILDPSSTFKLLYSLQIVDSLLLPNMTYVQGESHSLERTEWRERFIALGGVKHLTTILMSTDFYDVSRGSKRKTCLALLLKLVKYFLTEGDHLRFSVLGGSVEPRAFVGRLLDIIWGSTGDSHPATPAPMEEDSVQKGLPMLANGVPDVSALDLENINLLPNPLSVEGELVRYAMGLLCAAVITQRELLDSFMAYPQMNKWLYNLSLGSTDESIRNEFTKGLYSLCVAVKNDTQQPHPHTVFLKSLLGFLYTLDPWLPTCEQFFTFLNKLVSDSCDGAAGGSTADFAGLLEELIKKISTHPTTEARRGLEEDKVIIGLMNLMNTLVSKDPAYKSIAGQKNVIHEIFENGLFDIPTADAHGPLCPPKCKRRTTRFVAFQLLTELATNNLRNFRDLTSRLMKHHQPEERRNQWLYLPSGHEKAACGYVGLKNLGATCYMNSLMQQLYMIPGFRYGIFRAEDDEENKSESLLYQMQVIFGHLQESEKKYYDMQDFCNAYKCDGQPTNVSVQMDVDEFLTMMFDKLERALKKNNILKDFFGGTISNQIISKDCEHVSEREEGFFTLSLEVKDKKHILESLDLYVVGDMLEGDNKYFCGTCSKKVDALKRCCIKSLPNTLIVHAKRFEFDLEAMKRTKLNESLEFPMRLNMEPYTKEGLARIEREKQDGGDLAGEPVQPIHPPEYYEYELAGILVHAGTADSGHYYSFVKEREPLGGNSAVQWIYFNDTLVEPFNTDEIPKAAFGGYDTVQQLDSVQQKYVTRTHLRVNNAYMLFYDRVKQPAPKPDAPAAAPQVQLAPHVPVPSDLVPRPIFDHVWEENMKFLRDKNIFDVDYFSFLWPLVQLKPAPPQRPEDTDFDHVQQCIQLGTRFIVETLAHAKEKASLLDLVNSLKPLYHNHIQGSRWFLDTMLESEMEWPRQLLFACTTQDTREVFANLVVSVIYGLIEAGERGLYQEMEDDDEVEMEELDDDDDGEIVVIQDSKKRRENYYRKPRSLVVRFMDAYIGMLPNAHQFWRYFGQYFLVLRDFALLGPHELRVLLDRHLVYQLVDFYLGDDSPQGRMHGQPPRRKMGDKFSSPNLTHMAETLSALVRGCHTRVSGNAQTLAAGGNGNVQIAVPPTSLSGDLQAMMSEDLIMLYYPVLYVKALKEGIHQKSITEIILHLCWEDTDFSHKIIELIRQAINEVDHDGFKPYFDVFTPLLALADSKQLTRVDEGLTAYMTVIEANFKYKNATLASIRYLVETVQENLVVRNWMAEHLDDWVETWLLTSHTEAVREQAYLLYSSLLPADRDNASHEVRYRLFGYLIGLLPSARNHLREDRVTNEDLMSSRPTAPWRLVFYIRLLRLFTQTVQERQWFAPHNADLSDLLIRCDQLHAECDENKYEISLLWAQVLQASPESVRWIVRNERLCIGLMDYYISIRPGEKYRVYNNSSLPPFYQILNICCDHENFLERVGTHRNFDWALRYLFMETGDYPAVATVLYEILQKCSSVARYRQRHIQAVLAYDKHGFCFEHLRRFFELMLQTPQDLMFFCEKKGLEFLTRLFDREVKQATDGHTNETIPVLHLLDLLQKTTEWMLAPIPAATTDAPSTPPSTPTTPTSTVPTPTVPTPAQLQQKYAEIIRGWHSKNLLLENAASLYNVAHLSYFDHLLPRFLRVLEVVSTLDVSFLEQLLSGLHEQLTHEDDALPASLIANNIGTTAESMHRRRLMQHRDQYDRTETEEVQAYIASTSYNNFLINFVNFVLHSPSPTSATPSPSPYAPTVIELAVQITRNAYIQQRQPHAIKQHANLQMAILQYLIRLRATQAPPQPDPQLSPATSFTQSIDLLRQIWDDPVYGPILRENRSLDTLTTIILVDGYFLLDTHAATFEIVSNFYRHCAGHISAGLKEKLLRNLGEKIARVVSTCRREKQATGSWSFETLCSLIQILKSLKLILDVDPELKAAYLQEHQPLLAALHEVVVLGVNKDETMNGSAITNLGSSKDNVAPFPRLAELMQLTTSLLPSTSSPSPSSSTQ